MGRFSILRGAGRLSGIVDNGIAHALIDSGQLLPMSTRRSIGTQPATILKLLTFVRDTVHYRPLD
jgi:hypothetical protein